MSPVCCSPRAEVPCSPEEAGEGRDFLLEAGWLLGGGLRSEGPLPASTHPGHPSFSCPGGSRLPFFLFSSLPRVPLVDFKIQEAHPDLPFWRHLPLQAFQEGFSGGRDMTVRRRETRNSYLRRLMAPSSLLQGGDKAYTENHIIQGEWACQIHSSAPSWELALQPGSFLSISGPSSWRLDLPLSLERERATKLCQQSQGRISLMTAASKGPLLKGTLA